MSDLKQIAEEAGFTPTPNGAAWYANGSDLQRFATAVQQKAREQALEDVWNGPLQIAIGALADIAQEARDFDRCRKKAKRIYEEVYAEIERLRNLKG